MIPFLRGVAAAAFFIAGGTLAARHIGWALFWLWMAVLFTVAAWRAQQHQVAEAKLEAGDLARAVARHRVDTFLDQIDQQQAAGDSDFERYWLIGFRAGVGRVRRALKAGEL